MKMFPNEDVSQLIEDIINTDPNIKLSDILKLDRILSDVNYIISSSNTLSSVHHRLGMVSQELEKDKIYSTLSGAHINAIKDFIGLIYFWLNMLSDSKIRGMDKKFTLDTTIKGFKELILYMRSLMEEADILEVVTDGYQKGDENTDSKMS
ncbi:hypothetical protein LCGC14_0146160 [marine sediment metagenome]|uniref:Uncharacterized protein n=1 Tax=marine sediment metagenome TaxID=412755 RepID=A0A0F9UZW6_9ZZZZ